jgi:hypothetical protein
MIEREKDRKPRVETAVRPRVKTLGSGPRVVELSVPDMLVEVLL